MKRRSRRVIDSLHTLDDEDVIETIAESGEGETVEFKVRLPNATQIARDIAAFANTKGGLILYGIDHDGAIIGLDEARRFYEVVQAAFGTVAPSPKSISWGLVFYKGRRLGAILVNPGEAAPYFVDKMAIRRVGATNIPLDRQEFLTIRDERLELKSLRIAESEIRRFLKLADEDAFTEVLLIPFLRHLGFRSVLGKGHRDKTLEFGQDIRSFKFQLPTGHWLYFAAQVKTEGLKYSGSGKDANIANVLTQVKMAFDHEMFDVETNTMNLPDHVLLISSGEIDEGARLFLSHSLAREKRRKILVWEGRYLIEQILKEGLPEGCQIEIEKYVAQMDQATLE